MNITLHQVIAALLLLIQFGNFAVIFLSTVKPTWAFWVAAVVGALQAFVGRIQGTSESDAMGKLKAAGK